MKENSTEEKISRIIQSERFRGGPRWRWKLAEKATEHALWKRTAQQDPDVSELVDYLQKCRCGPKGKAEAEKLYPQIAAAELLDADPATRDPLRILVLGDCPVAEIAVRFEVPDEIIATWERVFFDVRDRRAATGWIFAQVIRPALDAGDRRLAVELKTALAGGPVAAQAVLDLPAIVPLERAERLINRDLALGLKLKEALEFRFAEPKEAMRFARFHMEYTQKEERLKLDKKRFAQHCEEAQRRYELGVARREDATARRHERAAERARKAQEKTRRRQALRELAELSVREHQERELADRRAREARIASSPLAKLKWREPQPAVSWDAGTESAALLPAWQESPVEFDAAVPALADSAPIEEPVGAV